MNQDSGVDLAHLKVDGGMVTNDLVMQIQADLLNVPVIRPRVIETTALGAAYAAGMAVGYWQDAGQLKANWAEDKRWLPDMAEEDRAKGAADWQKAVTRTYDWVEE